MSDLVQKVLAAYGGSTRWRDVTSVCATKQFGGAIWDIKHVPGIVDSGNVKVWIHDQHASLWPFTAANLKSAYSPGRVAIETNDGQVVDELDDPRASFAGHSLERRGRICSWLTLPATQCGPTPQSRSI